MFDNLILEIENSIKLFSEFDKTKDIQRIHKKNMFNKGHSMILSSFDEIKTLSHRLGMNIGQWVEQEHKIQRMPEWQNTKSGRYPDEVQIEMKKSDHLMKEVKVDFKALYLFSKIFLDQYAKFLNFINPKDGIRSGSVEKFLNSMKESNDEFYSQFLKELGLTADHIINKLTFYRSKKIEHVQILNEDTWFMNDMQGGIAIKHVDRDNGEGTSTITPKELLTLVLNFSKTAYEFMNINKLKIAR
jgi:hypothetical protein